MVMEVYDETMIESVKYYHSGADMPFNFRLLTSLTPSCGGYCIHKDVNSWMLVMPKGRWPNFVVSSYGKLFLIIKVTFSDESGSAYKFG